MAAPARDIPQTTPAMEERRATLVPVWREIPADLETPVSAYLKLARGRYAYLLESVEGGERTARYSFVGADPYLVMRAAGGVVEYRWLSGPQAGMVEQRRHADPLHAVQEELERRPQAKIPGTPRFSGGAVGYLTYDTAAYFEPAAPRLQDDP
ncbi:MAG: anthranilate synthase component I, partial [Ktedonobacterales bacterium]